MAAVASKVRPPVSIVTWGSTLTFVTQCACVVCPPLLPATAYDSPSREYVRIVRRRSPVLAPIVHITRRGLPVKGPAVIAPPWARMSAMRSSSKVGEDQSVIQGSVSLGRAGVRAGSVVACTCNYRTGRHGASSAPIIEHPFYAPKEAP